MMSGLREQVITLLTEIHNIGAIQVSIYLFIFYIVNCLQMGAKPAS